MHRSFGGTISFDICEHLGDIHLSGIIYLGGIPYFSAFKEVGNNLMGSTFQTLANPDTSATELSKAIVFLVDSCVADGYEISTEKNGYGVVSLSPRYTLIQHLYLMDAYQPRQDPCVRPLVSNKTQTAFSQLEPSCPSALFTVQRTNIWMCTRSRNLPKKKAWPGRGSCT